MILDKLFLLKQGLGWLLKLIPTILKKIDKVIFPFDKSRIFFGKTNIRFRTENDILVFFWTISNMSYADIEILTAEITYRNNYGTLLKFESNVFELVKVKDDSSSMVEFPISGKQLEFIKKKLEEKESLSVSVKLKIKVRDEYTYLEEFMSHPLD
ncbi:hypothetical protein [Leptospira brenneri]|uniref:hypothetical protein n=1 Tax=Leptospira brenneri TaxID=2023182 RepID=UPI000C2A24EF|nr:hypothetical protein [Leptospira brenneri]PJZ44996.1 hypothetical protein CH361_12150 [Leptospira brenneri]